MKEQHQGEGRRFSLKGLKDRIIPGNKTVPTPPAEPEQLQPVQPYAETSISERARAKMAYFSQEIPIPEEGVVMPIGPEETAVRVRIFPDGFALETLNLDELKGVRVFPVSHKHLAKQKRLGLTGPDIYADLKGSREVTVRIHDQDIQYGDLFADNEANGAPKTKEAKAKQAVIETAKQRKLRSRIHLTTHDFDLIITKKAWEPIMKHGRIVGGRVFSDEIVRYRVVDGRTVQPIIDEHTFKWNPGVPVGFLLGQTGRLRLGYAPVREIDTNTIVFPQNRPEVKEGREANDTTLALDGARKFWTAHAADDIACHLEHQIGNQGYEAVIVVPDTLAGGKTYLVINDKIQGTKARMDGATKIAAQPLRRATVNPGDTIEIYGESGRRIMGFVFDTDGETISASLGVEHEGETVTENGKTVNLFSREHDIQAFNSAKRVDSQTGKETTTYEVQGHWLTLDDIRTIITTGSLKGLKPKQAQDLRSALLDPDYYIFTGYEGLEQEIPDAISEAELAKIRQNLRKIWETAYAALAQSIQQQMGGVGELPKSKKALKEAKELVQKMIDF